MYRLTEEDGQHTATAVKVLDLKEAPDNVPLDNEFLPCFRHHTETNEAEIVFYKPAQN